MIIPLDATNANSWFDWVFHTLDVELFGAVGVMFFFILIGVFTILMLFNANKFTVLGFMGSLMLALGWYGYSIVGWIAPFGALIMGLLIGMAFIKMFQL
jgi:hypothetical protein